MEYSLATVCISVEKNRMTQFSNHRKLRTIKLKFLAKHLKIYLEESKANLNSKGGSQDSAKRIFNGVDQCSELNAHFSPISEAQPGPSSHYRS